MLCPYCGTENKEDVRFCHSCGYDITSVPTEATNEARISTTRTANAAPVRKRRRKKARYHNFRLLCIAAVGLISLVIGITLLASVLQPGNGFQDYEHNYLVEIVDGKLAILKDDKNAKVTKLEAATIKLHQTCIDGSVVAVLTDQNELAVIRNRKLTVVAKDVASFSLSVDGTGLAYTSESKESCTLSLYNVRNKKAKEITSQLIGSYEIAPDGDSVAYFTQEDKGDCSLMLYNGSKNVRVAAVDVSVIGTVNVSLLGISNDGKYIYAVAKDADGVKNLYCYDREGARQIIGPCNISTAFFNADHTQVLYYNSDGRFRTYLCTKDSAGIEIISSVASPLSPNSSENYTSRSTVTVPTEDLFDKVYLSYSEGVYQVWHIRKNSDSILLVSDVNDVTLSEDGKSVYYVEEDNLKVLKISDGTTAAEKAKSLAEGVEEYVVTSNGKRVYYTSGNSLYCVNGKNGKNKKTIASENVDAQLHINAKGVVYYMVGTDVFASKNGKKGKRVLEKTESIFSSANGIVYVFMNDDSLYATSGPQKPRLVWSND